MVYITKNCENKGNDWCGEEVKGLKEMFFFADHDELLYRSIHTTHISVTTKINLSSFDY